MNETNQLQQRLVVILHAQVCQQRTQGNPQHVCILPLCGIMRALLRHITHCPLGDTCEIPGCPITRKIQEHWLLCREVNCALCEPIRLPYRAHLAYAFPDAFKAGTLQAFPGQAASNPSPASKPDAVKEDSKERASSSSPTGTGRTTTSDPSPSPMEQARPSQSSGVLHSVAAPPLYTVGQRFGYPPSSSQQVHGHYPPFSTAGGPNAFNANRYALPNDAKTAGSLPYALPNDAKTAGSLPYALPNDAKPAGSLPFSSSYAVPNSTKPANSPPFSSRYALPNDAKPSAVSPPFSEDISPVSSPSLEEAQKSYTPSPEPLNGHPRPPVKQENAHLQPSPEQADTYPASSAMYGAATVQPGGVYQTASFASDNDQAKAYREYVNHAQAWLNSMYGSAPSGPAGISQGAYQAYQAATYQANTEEVDSD